jgi:TolA-binding protein
MTKTLDADSPNADKIWYELAWAQRANKDEEGSLQSFASLVKNHPNSSTAPEAHFLLGNKSYSDKQYDNAIEQFEKANVDSARDEIREKALYKLGWCYFRKGNFDTAAEQFKAQADNYSEGKLFADGRYMVAQCAYRANKFKEAFQAYTVAKPAVEESATVSKRIKQLTLLNGAKSGNKTKNYAEAASMARSLLDLSEIDDVMKFQANLELGLAENALGNLSNAADVLEIAAEDSGETGAHAQAMLGDILFKQAVDEAKAGNKKASKAKFGQAVQSYVDVYYGYGGSLASPEVKSWQAYAAYEAARCQMVQINDAEDVDKIILLGGAIKQFNYLVTRFPDSDLTPEAKKQLEKLNALKEKIGE